MSGRDEDLEPMAPALRALLDAGAEGPPAPGGVKDRLLHRVEATVRAQSDASESAPESERPPESWQRPAEAPTYVASAFDDPRDAKRARVRSWSISLIAAAFSVGLLTGGAVVYGLLRPADRSEAARVAEDPMHRPERPAAGTAPSSTASARETTPVAPTPSADPLPTEPREGTPVEGAGPGAASPSRDGASREVSTVAERALIETARTALARADAPAALRVLERHAREFPKGTFAEEREALAIQALAKTGEVGAATARAKLFRQRFPRSLFMPVVDEATLGD